VAALSPLPSWGTGENGKKKAKLVGWDNSLTEERRKKNTKNNTDKNRGIHRATLSLTDASSAPNLQLTQPAPHPAPSMTACGVEYPVFFGQFGSAGPTVSPPGGL